MIDSNDPIRIDRGELFTPAVDEALRRERAGKERILVDPPPVSPLRRLLLNSMFYLPLAAAVGALLSWLIVEPRISDLPVYGGEITLINTEPFQASEGVVSVTVADHDILVMPGKLAFEAGDDGQAAFTSFNELAVGTRVEIATLEAGEQSIGVAIRPSNASGSRADESSGFATFLLFPLTALAVALGLLISEGLSTRNWRRMISRSLVGGALATLFSLLAFIPAGLLMSLGGHFLNSDPSETSDRLLVTVRDLTPFTFLMFTACRSAAWACMGAAIGLGLNLVRSTRAQLRNSVIGGALGGAFGGMFFDPIDRFFVSSPFTSSETSRLVGLLAVGVAIGIFVALVENLGREAWLRVRTGPLAGKAFILYKTPTLLGSAPSADVYLFKDAGIDGAHAAIHRVGNTYELEDQSSRAGTTVNGAAIGRRRLASGDQIVLGSTILDFEERQGRPSAG